VNSILTVTVAATSRRLATETALRDEVNASTEPAASRVGYLLDQASGAVESYCGRTFARETVSETFRYGWGCAPDVLRLARRPIVSITSITEDGTALASDGREFDADAGLLWRLQDDSRIRWTARKITVVYVAGYLLPEQANPTLPADIIRATLITGAAMFAAIGRDPLLRSESVDGVASASYLDPRGTGVPPQAAELLAPYREIRI
jgi:hypothetical protein